VPVLADAGIARVINGPIPYSPDGNPYIGPERGLRNFFHCNTFSFGIAQGGGAGKALAEWVIDGLPEFDLWTVDRRRFKDYATFQYTVDKAVEVYQNEYAIGFPFEERPAGRPAYTSPLLRHPRREGCGVRRARWLGTRRVCRHRWRGHRPRADDASARTAGDGGRCREVHAARQRVALLDLPGFTKFEIEGPGAASVPRRAGVLEVAAARRRVSLAYALTSRGTVLSEFTITRLGEDRFYVVGARQCRVARSRPPRVRCCRLMAR
jgi:dimethylglycine dehydrogenase